MRFFSTRQVARLLGVNPAALSRAIWDDRIDPPPKGPSGNYLWRLSDIERASWVLCRKAFSGLPKDVDLLLKAITYTKCESSMDRIINNCCGKKV